MRIYGGLLLLLAVGCDARFLNQCSAPECPYANGQGGSLAGADMAMDLSGVDLLGADLTPASERVLAGGTFENRAGHAGSGGATLVQRSDGQIEVRFGADFSSSAVPGPAVFLTSRSDMGATIDTQADVNLGTLRSPMGAQSYVVPMGKDSGRRSVFVFCQPFRVEVTKATLVDR